MSQHYISCPTCGRVLAKNYANFMIERDNNFSDENKTLEEKSEFFTKLLVKYKYKQRCCRARIMGQNINPIPNLSAGPIDEDDMPKN
jgi:DNA-directed RNA polymerase subunit N (RpoN/RPB10)